MATTPSRGLAISGYLPPFANGALVYGENIQSGVITSAHIADGTIIAADVAAGSITSAKIGTGAVVNAKIGAGAVTSAKVGTSAITRAKVGVNAILNGALSAKVVTSAKFRAAFLSGTISGLSNNHVVIAHGLAVKPKHVSVVMIRTLGETTAKHSLALSTISAATSANIYVMSSKAGSVKYAAWVQL